MARLFTGIFPPDDQLPGIQELRKSADTLDVRWMPPANLHATLVFIGRVSNDEIGTISEALEQVQFDAFDVRLSDVGAFPDARKARVLWVGISPSDPVIQLQKQVARALESVPGVRNSASRPYHPHITVARSRGKRRIDARPWLDRHAGFQGHAFSIRSIALVKSRTKPEGAEYTIIERYGADNRSGPP